MKIVIVGNGVVGSAMARFFALRYEVAVHDPPKGHFATGYYDVAVICVPTPPRPDGSCDTSIVEKAVMDAKADLVIIKSTVPPGTTARLRRRAVFSPEYIGESKYYTAPEYPHPSDVEKHRFFIFGGNAKDTSACVDLFAPIVGPHPFFYQTDSTTAELIKYWENVWGALKVSFCNEMKLICDAFGVDYWKAREGWALDSRVEKMHTAVFRNEPGFGGKCFPKDLLAFDAAARAAGHSSPILAAIIEANKNHTS